MKTLKLSVFRIVWTAAVLVAVMSFVGDRLSGMLRETPRECSDCDFPTTLPREENRVIAGEGFSLIAPEGWTAICEERRLLFVPRNQPACRSRLQVTLLEDRYRHPVPLPATHTFQNGPAYSVVRTEPAAFGEPGRHELCLVIERNGGLYELRYESAGANDPGSREHVWEYFETFSVGAGNSIVEN